MLYRVGDKIINMQKLSHLLEQMLELRSRGFSQQDTANRLGLDRTVISKLESIGEIRKGGRIALIGFPLANAKEVQQLSQEYGIEYCLVLSQKERWNFLESQSGVQLFNQIMHIISHLHMYDILIVVASNMRIQLIKNLLGKEVIGLQIGESPIEEDKIVSIEQLRALLSQLQQKAGTE